MQKSCIVIPIHRFDLSRDEEVSWNSLIQSLPEIPKIIVAPRRFQADFQHFRSVEIRFFEDHYFTYPKGYNSLLLSKKFYQAFSSFRNILIYQLDCLICDSSRANLLESHWDYIGAPWSKNYHTKSGVEFEGVGNGGLSLRNVSSALRVLNNKICARPDYSMGPPPHWWHWKRVRKVMLCFNGLRAFLPKITTEQFLKKHYRGNEDIFWGKFASQIDPAFKVATVDEALHFAFESDPAGSYERIGKKLPFGCHAWAKHDRAFWEKTGVVEAKLRN